MCVQCDVFTDMGPPVLNPRKLGNVQLIPYPRGLQQNKHREWELNLCPSGSQDQLTTSQLLRLTAYSLVNRLLYMPMLKLAKLLS